MAGHDNGGLGGGGSGGDASDNDSEGKDADGKFHFGFLLEFEIVRRLISVDVEILNCKTV